MSESQSIVLVGCGNMGGALLRGWAANNVDLDTITVIDPDPQVSGVCESVGVTHVVALEELVSPRATVVIFAVKPQLMAKVVPQYTDMRADTLFVSVAAGTRLETFSNWLGDVPVVRAMPNMPAAIQQGMTVLCANAVVTETQRALCGRLLEAVGEVAWLEQEGLMDAVTAVSGSGPAYVFLFIEALAQAGVNAGLPDNLAQRLAKVTVAGAGQLALPAEFDAKALRESVSSPGGTTEQALKVLMAEGGLEDLIQEAVKAAEQRGKGLG
ncbi:MAG: pyrroline-5-carboxylate reductase [Gammaproteobacteria bacterium]